MLSSPSDKRDGTCGVFAAAAAKQDTDASSCLNVGRMPHMSSSKLRQHRYAPYEHAAASTHRKEKHGPASSQGDSPGLQRRKLLLQLAINMANSALESTLQHFHHACNADPGSSAAISALDAAEAAMAQTTRMTSLASVLASRCLQSSDAAACSPLLQQAQQLALQFLLPKAEEEQFLKVHQGMAAVDAAGAKAPVAVFAGLEQLMLLQHQQDDEDVEEGEEVSSSCLCSTSTATAML